MNYLNIFCLKTLHSSELKNKQKYNYYKDEGFSWIKQKNYENFKNILRFPTVGCQVEISKLPAPGFVLISSKSGKRIINKLCYF
jgi:hypothetical protein